jgi:hypothetical protein
VSNSQIRRRTKYREINLDFLIKATLDVRLKIRCGESQSLIRGPFAPDNRIARSYGRRHRLHALFCLAGIQENHEYPSQFASYLGNPGLYKNVI